MIFTHRDGSVVFTTKEAVEAYYNPRIDAAYLAQTKRGDFDADPNAVAKLTEYKELYNAKFKLMDQFESDELIDIYYLEAFRTSETIDELTAFRAEYTGYLENRLTALNLTVSQSNITHLTAYWRIKEVCQNVI